MMTELQAVNRMLTAIGEPPVKSLTSDIPEVINAKELLKLTSIEVLSKGWGFNTDEEVDFYPDSSGRIQVPQEALRIDASDKRIDVVTRAGYLFNKTDRTSIFNEPLAVDVVWFFEFKDLPQPAKQYIAVKAARRFQRDHLGSQKLDGMSGMDEQEAYLQLLDYESESSDFNLLRNNKELVRASMRI